MRVYDVGSGLNESEGLQLVWCVVGDMEVIMVVFNNPSID